MSSALVWSSTIGVHLQEWIQPLLRLASLKPHSVRYTLVQLLALLIIWAELQGQEQSAVIGEMREALIDNWA